MNVAACCMANREQANTGVFNIILLHDGRGRLHSSGWQRHLYLHLALQGSRSMLNSPDGLTGLLCTAALGIESLLQL